MAPRSGLVTTRLVLRGLVSGDSGWIARGVSRPQVQRMLPTLPHPYRLWDARAWLSGRARPGNYAIKTQGQPIGVVTLAMADGTPELGYWLAPEAWGKGFMTEAARAALTAHFADGGGDVPSGHVIDNLASRRVLTRLGFTDAGLIFRMHNFRGHEVVIRRMVLRRAAWEARDG